MEKLNFEENLIQLINQKASFPYIKNIENDDKNVEITFVYVSDKKLDNIVLVCPLGGRSLSKNIMNNIGGTNIWYKTYKGRNDIKFLYYFSINDSLSVRKPRNLNELSIDKLNDKSILFNGESKVSYFEMPKCKEDKLNKIITTSSTIPNGTLIRESFYSKNLKTTIPISIYLPYDFDKNLEYGLSLFTDGDEHIELLKANSILDILIYQNKVKPLIGLFIESNENRFRDLMCSPIYEKFIIDEILPMIKERYKISNKNKDNLISGFSLGGLTATYIGFRHSDIFGNILSQSGSYFFKMKNIKKLVYKSKKRPNIYLNCGVLEDKKRVIDHNRKIYSILKKNKFNVYYEEFPSGHDFLSWGEYLLNGLINLLQK